MSLREKSNTKKMSNSNLARLHFSDLTIQISQQIKLKKDYFFQIQFQIFARQFKTQALGINLVKK